MKSKSLAARLAPVRDLPANSTRAFDLWFNPTALTKGTSSFNEIVGPVAVAGAVVMRSVLAGAVAGPQNVAATANMMRPQHFRALMETAGAERLTLVATDPETGRVEFAREGSGLLSPALWNVAAQTWHVLKVYRVLRGD